MDRQTHRGRDRQTDRAQREKIRERLSDTMGMADRHRGRDIERGPGKNKQRQRQRGRAWQKDTEARTETSVKV